MTLVLYNSLNRTKSPFHPRTPGQVGLYLCGPTVYDRAHLGNARPVVVFDVLTRLLRFDYQVTYVRNITDIDDKIMNAAKARAISIRTITETTTRYYHEDMGALGALPPTHEPRATDYVPEMVAHIERLLEHGFAYEAEGHVLFDVPAFPAYGRLSGCDQDTILAGARVEIAPYKKNAQDFVLWKPSLDDQPGWPSPWGRGRPGWHIECSAMSEKLLGPTFDIHGGGQDLMFPHHENELAQSTCLSGPDAFATTWIHNGILTVHGEKMSKSLGNFLTVEDLLAQASGEVIRFALLLSHYRSSLDWTDESLPRSRASLDRLYRALEGSQIQDPSRQACDPIFLQALEDDLNTPLAIARLHELAHEIHQAESAAQKQSLQKSLRASAFVLGILQQGVSQWFQGTLTTMDPSQINTLIDQRQKARDNKDFQEADRIRQDLLSQGIILEDSPLGTTWRTS